VPPDGEKGQGVAQYMASNIAGARGGFVKIQPRVMPMGFSWVPAIAHRTAKVLLPDEDGVVWVDNFFILGDTREEVQ